MPHTGQTFSHPQTGETLTFLKTAADTNGEAVVAVITGPPGAAPPAAHVHPRQDETFAVQAGRMRLVEGGTERVLGPGDVATIPAGVPHTWVATGDEELRVTGTFTPALTVDAFFEDFWVGLAQAGRTKPNGMPRLLDMAVLLDDHRDVIYLAAAPVRVQRVVMAVLAKAGRRRRRRQAATAGSAHDAPSHSSP